MEDEEERNYILDMGDTRKKKKQKTAWLDGLKFKKKKREEGREEQGCCADQGEKKESRD